MKTPGSGRLDRLEKAARLRAAFAQVFGAGKAQGRVHVVRAPGRVNLIGEHTDYNDGFVLPAAIDRDVLVAVRAGAGRLAKVHSLDYGDRVEFDLGRLEPDPAHPWSNYVRGTLKVLLQRGFPLPGMELLIAGEVPQGAGLASSAALETATALAALAAGGSELAGSELALACQAAENDFVGVKCGIMDQLASALGKAGHALLVDCRSQEYELVPLPSRHLIAICDSGVRRGLRDSEYNLRRAQCEVAVRLLRRDLPEMKALRDVSAAGLEALGASLPPEIRRRATHVVLENERVLKGVSALRRGDVTEFGRLMAESQASLRDLFEVSCPELDALVEVAAGLPGVAGARMTGAGFGGCTVNLVEEGFVEDFRRRVVAEYVGRVDARRLSVQPQVHVCRAEDGAGEIANG